MLEFFLTNVIWNEVEFGCYFAGVEERLALWYGFDGVSLVVAIENILAGYCVGLPCDIFS